MSRQNHDSYSKLTQIESIIINTIGSIDLSSLVFESVPLEGGVMHETLRTMGTAESLLSLMSAQVRGEAALGRIHLRAQVARVRLVAKVRRHVNTQREPIVEALLAQIAFECARILVLQHVLPQHFSAGKGLRANSARISLRGRGLRLVEAAAVAAQRF
jgi:hypothetical protein